MTCDAVREQLLDLDVSEFEGIEHLEACDACGAWAQRIVEAETAVAARVERVAARGDFDDEWGRAKAAAGRPRRAWWPVLGLMAAAALALFVALPARPPAPSPDVAPVPVSDPIPAVISPEPVAAPALDPAPDPAPPRPAAARPKPAPRPAAPVPEPMPELDPAPDEPSAPAAAEPSPTPEPDPVASPPPVAGGTVVIEVDGPYQTATLTCPPAPTQHATVSGGLVTFSGPVGATCRVAILPNGPDGQIEIGDRYRAKKGSIRKVR